MVYSSKNFERSMMPKNRTTTSKYKILRWVVLAGTSYERTMVEFTKKLNDFFEES